MAAERVDQMARSFAQTEITTGEDQCAEAFHCRERTASSKPLSEDEQAFLNSEDSCSEKCEPKEAANPKSGGIRNIVERLWAVFQRSESKRIVASKMEVLRPSQRMPHQMKELLRTLSSKNERVARINSFGVRSRWQEIQGCDRWAELLHPMHAALRTEVFRYGEFAQAAYSAFERNLKSKYRGCKYTKENLLESVELGTRGYQVTQFLYTTTRLHLPNFFPKFMARKSWKDSNWMGFVAVCTSAREIARLGRRDILVSWRGTITPIEWIKDLQFWSKQTKLVEFGPQNVSNGAKVESGFLSVYNSSNEESPYDKDSAQDQVLRAVKELVMKYRHEELSITITGHSLGSALAILCAYDIAESVWVNQPQNRCSSSTIDESAKTSGKCFPSDRIPITVFSFAGPRVGNQEFKKRIEELGVPVLRLVNKNDMVPKCPGLIFDSYEHVGVVFEVNSLKCEIDEHITTGESNPTPYHKPEVQFHWLDFLSKLHEMHSLLGMLGKLSPNCVKDYVNIWEQFRRTRLQFRQRIRRSYLATTFSDFLQNFTPTENTADAVVKGD